MKKGFTQTLMMTAILVMAAQAMAMAPIIGEIPSPIVGDQETATPVNTFVYPDAIDLTQYVTDKDTTASLIVWSYEVTGTQIYKINGDPSLVPTDDPVAPPANKIIAGAGAVETDLHNDTTTHTQDGNPNTITIRNIALTPLSGVQGTPLAAGTMMPQDVTLYASDGDTVGIKIVTFFTNTGKDHLSFIGIPVSSRTPGSGSGNSTGFDYTAGTDMTSSVTGNGLCMTVGTQNKDKLAFWEGTFGDIVLVANNAYRIRLIVNGTQTDVSQVPLWDLVIRNFKADTTAPNGFGFGMDLYAADFWMFDNAGSQNAAVQLVKGDTTYDFWWTPSPVLTARWNSTTHGATQSGPFDPINATDKNAIFEFRIVDSPVSRPDLHPNLAVGTLCLKQFRVDRYDLSTALVADPTPIWQTTSLSWVAAPAAPGIAANSMHMDTNTNVAVTYTAGSGVTLHTASGNGVSGNGASGNCYAQIAPGDNVGLATGDIFTESNIVDNYPAPFDSKSLYKVTYMLCAPTQADEDHPVDALFLGGETFDDEAIQVGYVDTHAWHCGMPAFKVTGQADATPQPYVFLFYTNFGQSASNPSYWGWKPTLSITNNNAFISSGSGETKVGAIKLSSIKIEKITSGMN
jgi:hypothetical protein